MKDKREELAGALYDSLLFEGVISRDYDEIHVSNDGSISFQQSGAIELKKKGAPEVRYKNGNLLLVMDSYPDEGIINLNTVAKETLDYILRLEATLDSYARIEKKLAWWSEEAVIFYNRKGFVREDKKSELSSLVAVRQAIGKGGPSRNLKLIAYKNGGKERDHLKTEEFVFKKEEDDIIFRPKN